MPSLTSRNQPGRREDLSDVIAVTDARNTPVSSAIPKGAEPTNPQRTWQSDDYPKPRITGVVDEQDVTEFENFVGRVPLSGRIQIVERKPKVSRIAQNVADVAGVGKKKEFAKSVAKSLTMVKRDIESKLLSFTDSQEDDGVVGYETRGIPAWINDVTQNDLPVPAKVLTPAASILRKSFGTITEQDIRDTVLGSIFDQTGMNGKFVGVVGRQLKQLITGWSVYYPNLAGNTIVRSFKREDDTVLFAAVDMIQGDFGSIELWTSTFMRQEQPSLDVSQQNGLILDLDMFEICYNERPNFRAFEDLGGGPRGLTEAIWMLVCKTPLGMGRIDPGSTPVAPPTSQQALALGS